MNKTDLLAAMVEKSGLTKKAAAAALDALTATVQETLKAGDKVTLVGFGTFEPRTRAARNAVNPRTKKKIKVPAAKVPAFKAGKSFKDALN